MKVFLSCRDVWDICCVCELGDKRRERADSWFCVTTFVVSPAEFAAAGIRLHKWFRTACKLSYVLRKGCKVHSCLLLSVSCSGALSAPHTTAGAPQCRLIEGRHKSGALSQWYVPPFALASTGLEVVHWQIFPGLVLSVDLIDCYLAVFMISVRPETRMYHHLC